MLYIAQKLQVSSRFQKRTTLYTKMVCIRDPKYTFFHFSLCLSKSKKIYVLIPRSSFISFIPDYITNLRQTLLQFYIIQEYFSFRCNLMPRNGLQLVKWKISFLTCHCNTIYSVETVGLSIANQRSVSKICFTCFKKNTVKKKY